MLSSEANSLEQDELIKELWQILLHKEGKF